MKSREMFKPPHYQPPSYPLFKPPPPPLPAKALWEQTMDLLKKMNPGCGTCAALKSKRKK